MPDSRDCPKCGTPLPVAVPRGHCVRCLLQLSLDTVEDDASLSHPMGEGRSEGFPQLSNYRLLQKIGEGGCGMVYLAEQRQPVRRHVAVKVIKLGMDTKAVIARFEAERQALALMDHANIAKVLDAGATESGRPFFVMELVRTINSPIRETNQIVETLHRSGPRHDAVKAARIIGRTPVQVIDRRADRAVSIK